MDILDWLIRILTMLFLGLGLGVTVTSSSGPMPPPVIEDSPIVTPEGDAMQQVPSVVEQVEAVLLESDPVQIQLRVVGYHPDGCEVPLSIAETHTGSQVRVEIYRELPADVMCPMMILPFEETIRLTGGFAPGTYQIDVNGVTVEVTV